jgi:hypothetical protein
MLSFVVRKAAPNVVLGHLLAGIVHGMLAQGEAELNVFYSLEVLSSYRQ